MKLHIDFNLDNDSFTKYNDSLDAYSISNFLGLLGTKIEDNIDRDRMSGNIHDSNGKTIGKWEITND